MSDPMNTDPRMVDPPVPPNPNRRAMDDMKDANSLWTWNAGGILLLLVVVLIFGNLMNPSSTAGLGDQNTPSRTGMTQNPQNPAPPRPPVPPATTGQGGQ